MDDCTITRDGEQFVVAVDADRNTVTITDQYGKVGTITPSGGTLHVVVGGTSSSVVRQTDGALFSARLARVTLARMSDAFFVQMNGLGASLC